MKNSKSIKMTDRNVAMLPGPKPGSSSPSVEYTCLQLACLVLAVFVSGARSWRIKIKVRGRRISYTFGKHPTWSVKQAIEHGRKLLRLADQGIDPRHHINGGDDVYVHDFVRDEFKPYIKKLYKSWKNSYSILNKWIVPHLGDRVLQSITRKDVTEFHRMVVKAKSGTTANRCFSLLSSLFKLAMLEKELIDVNPCQGVKKAPENKSRDRYLHQDEFERFIKVLIANLNKRSYQLIFLLTALGLRSGELKKLKWSDVNLSDATIYIRDPKNGESRYVPLNSAALDLLTDMDKKRKRSCPWVFESKKSKTGHLTDIRKPFQAVCEAAGIDPKSLRPHDLRRSFAVHLLEEGTDHLVVRDALGHKSLQSTMVYARVTSKKLAQSSEIASDRIKAVSS